MRAFAPDDRPQEESELELLDATASGDERAFEELRHRYQRRVERVCRNIVGGVALDDCVQEVFLRIWRKAHLFDVRRGSAPAWILTIARNVARSQRRDPVTLELSHESIAVRERATVDEVWVRNAVAQLPTHERRVIELAYVHGLTQREIAHVVEAPLGTVKTWNRRALGRLADLLEEYEL